LAQIIPSWAKNGVKQRAPEPFYMSYMFYMVKKAAVPSAFSLQPDFLTMKIMKNMKEKSVDVSA